MEQRDALRTVRRALVRFGNKTGVRTLSEYRRLVSELNTIVDDVNTETGKAPAARSETVHELLRLGVLYRVCLSCGNRLEACPCPPESAGTRYELNLSVLSDLASVPTI